MEYKKCKSCGTIYTINEGRCPKCECSNAQFISTPKTPKGCIIAILIAVALFIFLIKFIIDMGRGPDDGDSFSDNGKYYACAVAESEVKERLKSPSSAIFDSCDDMTITNSGDTWYASGYVEAQNSFGAMVKTYFSVSFERTGEDTYTLISASVD